MNLRVNLLAAEERRNASMIQGKTLIQSSVMFVAGLAALWIALTVLSFSSQRSRLKADKWRWQRMDADYNTAVQTRADLNAVKNRLGELSAYQRTRVDWHRELRAIGAHVPADIQLTELRVSQSVATDTKVPSRTYALRLLGRTGGPTAEPTVRAFFTDLGAHPDFTNLLASATVGSFRSDTSAGATESDRVFEINCAGKPRKFE
jgi:hypothetical protein